MIYKVAFTQPNCTLMHYYMKRGLTVMKGWCVINNEYVFTNSPLNVDVTYWVRVEQAFAQRHKQSNKLRYAALSLQSHSVISVFCNGITWKLINNQTNN